MVVYKRYFLIYVQAINCTNSVKFCSYFLLSCSLVFGEKNCICMSYSSNIWLYVSFYVHFHHFVFIFT